MNSETYLKDKAKYEELISRLDSLDKRLEKTSEYVRKKVLEDKKFYTSKEYKLIINGVDKFINCFSKDKDKNVS